MIDVERALGIKKMSDIVKKEMHGIFETKNPTEEQIKKCKMLKKELDKKSNYSFKYVLGDFMSKIIKNCRGVTKAKMR